MFVVVWQFEIAEDKVAGFEAAYGADGAWAQLFRTSPEYLGTELLRDAYVPGNYLTIDRWSSEQAFRAFRKDHDGEYDVSNLQAGRNRLQYPLAQQGSVRDLQTCGPRIVQVGLIKPSGRRT